MFRILGISLFLIIISSNLIYSQEYAIDKGSKFVGGSFSFSSAYGILYTKGTDRVTNIKLSAEYGYFIEKGLVISGILSLNNLSSSPYGSTQTGIGPKIYYYFGDETNTAYPFIDAGASLISSSSSKLFSRSGTGTSFHVGFGLCYIIKNSLGLFSEISYENDEVSPNYNGTGINFTLGINTFFF